MSGVLIYKGSAGEIYSISDGETQFNKSEFMNGTIESVNLLYDYRVNYVPEDFVRLRIMLQYIVAAKETGATLDAANLTRDFRVVRRGRILPEDVLIALRFCVDLMNQDKEKDSYSYPYLPVEFEQPTLENQNALLVQIAQELNDR